MATRTKGKCKYCGREFTKAYMLRHLPTCKERKARLEAEAGERQGKYFELAIYDRYNKEYWLIIEISQDATLADLDFFLRDIWLECCGHMSMFQIGDASYMSTVIEEDDFWGPPPKSMDCKLKNVLHKDMSMTYEYDFGSTTALIIDVRDDWTAARREEPITILSRNNPLEFLCETCHKKKATAICIECYYTGSGLLCDGCAKKHGCGEEMQLPICNSPRMGVCAYEGSCEYPDQFLSDPELAAEK